jgi:hypothetical protein
MMDARNLLKAFYSILADNADVPKLRFHDLRHSAATLLLVQGVLWLATEAVRTRNPAVRFESASQILTDWGLSTGGEYYRRLAGSFRRVFGSTIFFGTHADQGRSEVWDCSRIHFVDHVRLWFQHDPDADGRRRENLVTLSAPFWEELRNHPIPVDAAVVRALANNPGCLDLYTWLTWRCYQAKGIERIPFFGPLLLRRYCV